MDSKRKLRIQSKYRERTFDSTTVPEIRLVGKWLDELGFKEGKQVVIDQKKNKLTIKLLAEKREK